MTPETREEDKHFADTMSSLDDRDDFADTVPSIGDQAESEFAGTKIAGQVVDDAELPTAPAPNGNSDSAASSAAASTRPRARPLPVRRSELRTQRIRGFTRAIIALAGIVALVIFLHFVALPLMEADSFR